MEINSINTISYVDSTTDDSDLSLWQLPKMLWAGAILFAINLMIGTGIVSTPEMNVDIYGESVKKTASSGSKPSPFIEAEPVKRTVRAATKLQPIVSALPENDVLLGRAYRLLEYQVDFSRVSATASQLKTVPAVQDSVARPTSERPLVVN